MCLRGGLLLVILGGLGTACVKGSDPKIDDIVNAVPPRVDRFIVSDQGWCGECADITVDWSVVAPNPETKVSVVVVMDNTVQHVVEAHSGSRTFNVCGNAVGSGLSGVVALLVEGLTPAPPPIPLQQTIDGEIRTLTFDPVCPFVDAWQHTAFTEALFPSTIRVDRIRNWTFYDLNGDGVPQPNEPAPKIKVSHAPELDWIIAQDTWTDLPQLPTQHGTWEALPENLAAFGDRCMEPGGVPSTEIAIPLVAKVRMQCSESP